MGKTFQLEILASDRPFYVGKAEHLVFPTVDGLVGILPDHESMVTIVEPGELKYLVDHEWVRRADDALWRRTKQGMWLNADQQSRVSQWLVEYTQQRLSLAS